MFRPFKQLNIVNFTFDATLAFKVPYLKVTWCYRPRILGHALDCSPYVPIQNFKAIGVQKNFVFVYATSFEDCDICFILRDSNHILNSLLSLSFAESLFG